MIKVFNSIHVLFYVKYSCQHRKINKQSYSPRVVTREIRWEQSNL